MAEGRAALSVAANATVRRKAPEESSTLTRDRGASRTASSPPGSRHIRRSAKAPNSPGPSPWRPVRRTKRPARHTAEGRDHRRFPPPTFCLRPGVRPRSTRSDTPQRRQPRRPRRGGRRPDAIGSRWSTKAQPTLPPGCRSYQRSRRAPRTGCHHASPSPREGGRCRGLEVVRTP